MVRLKVNGTERSFDGDPSMPLLWCVRDVLELTGTKFGCGIAQCGAEGEETHRSALSAPPRGTTFGRSAAILAPITQRAAGLRVMDGRCTCAALRYRLTSRPLFVHCCHCRWCQRETGTAFALNAMIEADRVVLLAGEPEVVATPSESGKGQKISRCPTCRVAVWSNYAGAGDAVRFVRVGTLEEPDRLPPDIHIFTMSKQPWVLLPKGVPAVPEYYSAKHYWPEESLARWRTLRGS